MQAFGLLVSGVFLFMRPLLCIASFSSQAKFLSQIAKNLSFAHNKKIYGALKNKNF